MAPFDEDGTARHTASGIAPVFLDATQTGVLAIDRLPAALTLDEGLRTQIEVLGLRTTLGSELGGWKVGLTSGQNRDAMGAGFRPFGYILKSRIFESGCVIGLDRIPHAAIEAELAFELHRPLSGPAVSAEEAADAIAGVRPAFELNQRRTPRPCDPGIQIADDLSQWGIVIGGISPWTASIDTVSVTVSKDSKPVETAGPHYAIDDPVTSIRRVCASLDRVGLGLEPGQQIITGAFFRSGLERPARWSATFPGIGTVSAVFG